MVGWDEGGGGRSEEVVGGMRGGGKSEMRARQWWEWCLYQDGRYMCVVIDLYALLVCR